MSRSRQTAPLPEGLQRALRERRAWLLREPKKAFYWLLGHLRVFPRDPELNIQLALTTKRLGERDLARGYLSQALHALPAPKELRHSYLELLVQEGHYSQALSTGLRWIKDSPEEAALYMVVGYALEKIKGAKEALAYYEHAFKLGERSMFSHYLLMRAVDQLHGAARALPYATHHFNSYPEHQDARAWLLCAEILIRSRPAGQGEPLVERTLIAYERALRAQADHSEAHYRLAQYYARRDESRAYTHALRARGAGCDPGVYLLLCQLELKRGDKLAARHALHMYERLNQGQPSDELTQLKARVEER